MATLIAIVLSFGLSFDGGSKSETVSKNAGDGGNSVSWHWDDPR